jgi:electron-transferring-flavoprotein dehydrogenase
VAASPNGSVVPSAYPPPVRPVEEFVGPPVDPEDERIEVGVVIVGGGPAGLACANRLLQLLAEDEQLAEQLGEVPVAVVEKGKACGAHALSGAIMRPSGIEELFPGIGAGDFPNFGKIDREAVFLMPNARHALRIPVPPPFRNHGSYVVSVAELSRWLATRAEEAGAYVLTETSATKLLVSDGVVRGVRSGDKGRGREGEELANFEPGSDLVAKATVLAEGVWGHLTGAAIRAFGLGHDPQEWALGVKEVWELPKPLGRAMHTLGWPLRFEAQWGEFGGSWIYPMNREGEAPKVSIGFVCGLNHTDATLSVHDVLQEFKTHPTIRRILEGGTRVAWGAKAIPEGGWWAMPTLHAPGLAIAGDGGGMVNVPELKGVHYAIHAGILAAEHIVTALRRGSTDLSGYDEAVRASRIGAELYRSRNMKQPFRHGFLAGGAITNAMVATGGRLPGGHWRTHPDADAPVRVGDRHATYPRPDGTLTFDKLSSVYISGNQTRDDAPNHIRVQRNVPRALAETWKWMCPAGVYEIPDDAPAEGNVDLTINPSNCVQCGAITAKGGRLTPPEGGDGPLYTIT